MPSDPYDISGLADEIWRERRQSEALDRQISAQFAQRRAAEQRALRHQAELASEDKAEALRLLQQFVQWAYRNKVPTNGWVCFRRAWMCSRTEGHSYDMNPGSEPSRGSQMGYAKPSTTYITTRGELIVHREWGVNDRTVTLDRARAAVAAVVSRTDIPWP
jgi:hypothetical protein